MGTYKKKNIFARTEPPLRCRPQYHKILAEKGPHRRFPLPDKTAEPHGKTQEKRTTDRTGETPGRKPAAQSRECAAKKSEGLSRGKESPGTREWAKAIDELRPEYPLDLLLKLKRMARSVFYYHLKHLKDKDKYAHEKELIKSIYHEHKGRYGYRRVTAEMRNRGFTTNHKTVRRLMDEMELKSRIRKVRYRSYRHQAGKTAPNIIARNFRAEAPNRKWATDVTQINIGPAKLYLSPIIDMFNGEALAVKNPELIYATPLNNNIISIAFPLKLGGWNGLGITQKLIDAYYMKDGEDYVQQPDYYEEAGTVPTIATGYELRPTVAKMYLDREPRFYASIGFCECFWPATSVTGTEAPNVTNFTAGYYVNGNCAKQAANPEDYNLTGYTLKKYIHPEDNCTSHTGAKIKPKTFPVFRYAEILLNYVEALNELKGEPEYTEAADNTTYHVLYNPEEIMYYFNMIRYRAGLPGITLADASDQVKMRQLIIRERMIEFACEGRRYHDLRRWGLAETEENKPPSAPATPTDKELRQPD